MHHAPVDRRRLLTLALGTSAGACAALAGWPAAAQERTVRFILPNATGSGVDAITRAAQPALAKALGHAVIVDNQAGAGGVVGLQALARSPADGFTLSVVSNNVVIFPSVLKSIPFDMPGDFTPIAVVGYTPIVLVVHPKVAATNAKEFAALLKARGSDMNYASGGNGTILHLATEMFLDEAGAKARHIPYKGVGPCSPTSSAGRCSSPPRRCRACSSTLPAGRCGPSAWPRASVWLPPQVSRPLPSRACPATTWRPGSP
jgi:tripartite-type tricarboxylate transporter receptor subunit TctC